MTPDLAIREAESVITGESAVIAGSSVASLIYGIPDGWKDVDVFTPTRETMVSVVQRYLDSGAVPIGNDHRKWERWKQFGFGSWKTNSIRLETLSGLEVNVIHKLTGPHPVQGPLQVAESFDFGHLLVMRDVKHGVYRDLRSAMFPGWGGSPMTQECDLLPDKAHTWRQGYFSQHLGLRECGRWAKFTARGWDLARAIPVLTAGYEQAALYYQDKDDPAKRWLATFYLQIAKAIDGYDVDQLLEYDRQIKPADSLEMIMESLQ